MSFLTPENFAVADFETSRIEETKKQKFYCGGIYQHNNADNVFISDSIEDIINYFIRSEIDIFYFHNLGYDFRFLFDYLLDNYELDIMPYGSGVLKVTVYKNYKKLFELRDSFALLRTSLKAANKSFNQHYFKLDIGNDVLNFDKNNLEHIRYLKHDCLSLYESLSRMKEIYNFKKLYLTIAGASMGAWKETYDIKKLELPKTFDYFFRLGYFGGRTEVFKQYDKKKKRGYDFNSLYPAVMEKNKYPIGPIYRTPKEYDLYDLLEHDFFYAKIRDIQIPVMNIPPLPVRYNNSLVFPVGYIPFGVYNSVDIRLLLEMGGTCKLDYGYFWGESNYIFRDFVLYYYDLKTKAKKNKDWGEYERAKRTLTNNYGKFAQKNEVENFIMLDKKARFDMLKKGFQIKPTEYFKSHNLCCVTKAGIRKHTTTHISSFITSYARLELYLAFMEVENAGKTVYYGDTDSIYTDYAGFQNVDKYKLGALDCEYPDIIDSVFALPKLYGLKTKEKNNYKIYNFNGENYDEYNNQIQKTYLKGKGLRVADLDF